MKILSLVIAHCIRINALTYCNHFMSIALIEHDQNRQPHVLLLVPGLTPELLDFYPLFLIESHTTTYTLFAYLEFNRKPLSFQYNTNDRPGPVTVLRIMRQSYRGPASKKMIVAGGADDIGQGNRSPAIGHS